MLFRLLSCYPCTMNAIAKPSFSLGLAFSGPALDLCFHRISNLKPPAHGISNRHCPKLESLVSHRKQTTGDFLIANFGAILASRFFHFELLEIPVSVPSSLPASISNRHTPELEIELSHRKQRIGPSSNRNCSQGVGARDKAHKS